MGLKPDDDKRPSKLAIMDDDISDKPSKFVFLVRIAKLRKAFLI